MANLTFDFDQVTPRMLVDFKKHTGTSLMALMDDTEEFDLADLDEEVVAGVIWLALRMSGQPDATWDDALDTPFSSVEFGVEEDPTTASDES